MIKVGIAAQYLHDLEHVGRAPSRGELEQLRAMLVDSDDTAAETLYVRAGGEAMLRRVVGACNLRGTKTRPGWWSQTQMTAADAALLGACVAAGRVVTAEWAGWILGQMRSVRGEGRFGIIDARPLDSFGRPLAIKNGWSLRDDGWHVNCLAIDDNWTMAVMLRYPAERGLKFGAALCRTLAAGVLPAAAAPTPAVV